MRWVRRSLYIVLALLVALIICALLLVGSSSANQWVIHYFSKQISGLSIEGSSGSLLSGLEFKTLKYTTNQQHIQISHAKIDLSTKCLLHSQLCVEKLTADGLDVAIKSSSTQPTDNSNASSEALAAFWPIKLKSVDFRNAHINIDGQDISWRKLTLNASWVKQRIQINALKLEHLRYQDDSLKAQRSSTSKSEPTAVPQQLSRSLTHYLSVLQLPYQIDIKDLQLVDGQLNLSQSMAVDKAYLQGTLDSQQLNISRLAVDSSQGSLSGQIKLQLTSPYQSEFNLKANRQNIGQVLAKGVGPASALHIDANYQGKANLNVSGELNWLSRSLPYSLKLTANSSAKELQPIKQMKAQLALQGSLKGYQGQLSSQLVSIEPLDIKSTFSGDYRQIPQFELSAKSGAGELKATGALSWSPQLVAHSKVTIHQLDLSAWAGQSMALINGLATASYVDNHWHIKSDKLSGTWQQHPWSIALEAKGVQGDVNHLNVSAKLADNRLFVSGSVHQKLDLTAVLKLNNLAVLPWLDAGKLHGKLALSGPRLSPFVSWSVDGQELKISQYDTAIASLRSSAKFQLTKSLPGQLSLVLKKANYQNYQNIAADIHYRHPLNANQQLTVQIKNSKQSLALNIAGQGDINKWQGNLNKLALSSPVGRFNLPKKAAIAIHQQQLTLSPLCLKQENSASICLTQPTILSADKLAVQGKVQQFELAPLAALWLKNLSCKAHLNGQFSLSRNKGQPLTASVKLSSENGQLIQTLSSAQTVEYGYQSVQLNAQLTGAKAALALKAKSQQLGDTQANLSIGLDKTQHYPLQGDVVLAHLQLAPYTSLLNSLSQLDGQLNGRLRIAGGLNNPDLSGNISISNGKLEGPNLPLAIENLSSDIKLAHRRAQISGSFLSHGHKASWQGHVSWQNAQLSGQLALKGDHLGVHYPPADLVVSPDLKLAVDSDNMQIQGQLKVDKGMIKVKKLPQKATSLSSDVSIVDAKQKSVASRALNMDVTVDLGDSLYLDAFGLTTQLAGKLNVQQSSGKAMQTTGQIDLQDGKFIAYGQYLEIQSGTLTFSGSANSPMINVKAIRDPEKTEDDVTVGVTASGTPKQLTVSLFSDPSMAQNEQLSYLLRGHGITDDSDSSALTSLLLSTGLNQTGELVTKLGDRVGIKQLSLSTSGSGDDTQVQLSGYLLPGVQLKYGRGMFEASNEITLRYQLIPKFYLEVVSGLENAIDLYYEFSID